MADQEKDELQNTDNVDDVQAAVDSPTEETRRMDESAAEEHKAYKGYRETSYGVLFIAAVFVINAMETGSYRTPWPVAIVVSLIGLGLYGYSWFLQSKEK
ncbi:MAG: hypothetical protein IME97_08440 [Proteobacteria bacterium]|nr:hypothetical protein [Pseudomonadota bacterium]